MDTRATSMTKTKLVLCFAFQTRRGQFQTISAWRGGDGDEPCVRERKQLVLTKGLCASSCTDYYPCFTHSFLTETLCRMYFSNYPHFTNDTLGLRGISNLLKTEELIYKQWARNSTPASLNSNSSPKHYAKMPLYNLEGISTNKRKQTLFFLTWK